mgnify:CR=1 FL=1
MINKKFEKIIIKVNELMILRGFTKATKKTYLNCISNYLKFVKQKDTKPDEISAKAYLLLLNKLNKSNNTIRIYSASILFLLKDVLKLNVDFKIILKPKKESTLPKVLSKNEIKLILNNISNHKHKLMIEFLYSTGIRLNELINMKRSDIESERNLVKVSLGKGKKDRYTLLSSNIKKHLIKYLCENEFKSKYLFETNRGSKYSSKSIQNIITKASKCLDKNVTTHMFRHSFATHLLENGTDIRIIQKLLGHSKIETTMIYTKVATSVLENIISPFDEL